MHAVFRCFLYNLVVCSLTYGTTFHITNGGPYTVWDANQASVNGDTILLHVPVTDKVDVENKTLYIIGIDTVPQITYTGQISSKYGALECENSMVTIRNIRFAGANGNTGTSYCGYNTCGHCDQGGNGGQGLILRNSHAILENCIFTGGTGGKGGMSGSKGCYACSCSPCNYCPDGNRGKGLILCNNSRADTLNVSFDSDSLDSTSKIYRFDVTTVTELSPQLRSARAKTPLGECTLYDLQGRKLPMLERQYFKERGSAGGIIIARNGSNRTWTMVMPVRLHR